MYHVLRHAEKLVSFVRGVQADVVCVILCCVLFRLTNFVLRDCGYTFRYCVRLIFVLCVVFCNKIIIMLNVQLYSIICQRTRIASEDATPAELEMSFHSC